MGFGAARPYRIVERRRGHGVAHRSRCKWRGRVRTPLSSERPSLRDERGGAASERPEGAGRLRRRCLDRLLPRPAQPRQDRGHRHPRADLDLRPDSPPRRDPACPVPALPRRPSTKHFRARDEQHPRRQHEVQVQLGLSRDDSEYDPLKAHHGDRHTHFRGLPCLTLGSNRRSHAGLHPLRCPTDVIRCSAPVTSLLRNPMDIGHVERHARRVGRRRDPPETGRDVFLAPGRQRHL